MTDHPLFIPKPHRGQLAVRWLKASDGRCHAKEYRDAKQDCAKSLAALAMQMALKGTVGKVPENGHKLHGDFEVLWVLKPGDHRILGFRHLDSFYLTNGAPKQPKHHQQEPDYREGMRLRSEFRKSLGLKDK